MRVYRVSVNGPLREAMVRAVAFGRKREIIVLVLVLYGVLRTDPALADQLTAEFRTDKRPPLEDFGPRALSNEHPAPAQSFAFDALRSFTESYSALHFPASARSADGEFRPLGKSLSFDEPQNFGSAFAPRLQTTTAWQELKDCKSRGGVRLLTLWQSTWSTLSLQAGNHGDPSLQWTSRSLNFGGASRGLLDRLFSLRPSRDDHNSGIEPVAAGAHPARQTETTGTGPVR